MEINETEGQRDPQTYALIGAAIDVHRELGAGFLEPVYREALSIELDRRRLPWVAEPLVGVKYKDRNLTAVYRPDFICYDSVLIEVKALKAVGPFEMAQVLNYLKATGLERALLLNFGARRLEHRRLIRSTTPATETDEEDTVDLT